MLSATPPVYGWKWRSDILIFSLKSIFYGFKCEEWDMKCVNKNCSWNISSAPKMYVVQSKAPDDLVLCAIFHTTAVCSNNAQSQGQWVNLNLSLGSNHLRRSSAAMSCSSTLSLCSDSSSSLTETHTELKSYCTALVLYNTTAID